MATDLESCPPHMKMTSSWKLTRHGFTLASYGGDITVFVAVPDRKLEYSVHILLPLSRAYISLPN